MRWRWHLAMSAPFLALLFTLSCPHKPAPYEPPPQRPPPTDKEVCAQMLAGAAVAEWARVDENTEPGLEMRLAMECWAALEATR